MKFLLPRTISFQVQMALWLLLSGLSSCGRITLEVGDLPKNTPSGSSIFVSGNFNLWDAGDGNFRLRQEKNGKYYVNLPLGWGKVEYKFTRGDWTTVEGDGCGHTINNRTADIHWNLLSWFSADTLQHDIYSWEDQEPTNCDRVTFRIKKLPKETPAGSSVYLVGSFNDWRPGDRNFAFRKDSISGYQFLSLPKSNREIEYKLTRGNWNSEEVDINGDRLPNRKFVFGARDTVDLEIAGWVDLNPGLERRTVSFLVQTPIGTPSSDPLYIVGNFNHWVPGDPKFEMKRLGPNLFFISILKPEGEMEYKFTRGPWGMEEVDVYGNHISNRKLRTSADTVKISIPEWLDIPVEQTFTLNRDEINYLMNNPDVVAFPVNIEKGEKAIKFSLVPAITEPTYIYIRVSLPLTPNNRNYGLVDLVKPGQELKLVCPEGTVFYACDGPYWQDNEPKEVKVFTVHKGMEGKKITGYRMIPPK